MKKEIKIGNKTFEFENPNILDKSTTNMMNDWCRLVEQQKNNEDVWTVIPELPQYKFKNLKVESSPFETTEETTETTVTFKYDEYMLNQMKGKLIKQNGIGIQTIDGIDYYLILDGKTYHTNPLTSDLSNGGKLSKQNCDEIFGVVDFGKLANYEYPIGDDWSPEESLVRKLAFLNGVDKAMDLNKDKLFTLEDMELMFEFGYRKNDLIEITFEGGLNFIQSLQQPTEIEVEVEMENYGYCEGCRKVGMWHCAHADTCGYAETRERPKLDSDGCLILKKIESYE